VIVIRADSGFENHKQMRALDGRGIEFSIGVKQSKTIRALIDQIPESDWVAITDYPESGQLQIAETQLGMWRRIVRRTRLVGAQGELFPDLRHHCFATNRTVPILIADVDHRDHATIELVIRDLTAAYGHSECPARWPWQHQFTTVLNTLRALPAFT